MMAYEGVACADPEPRRQNMPAYCQGLTAFARPRDPEIEARLTRSEQATASNGQVEGR